MMLVTLDHIASARDAMSAKNDGLQQCRGAMNPYGSEGPPSTAACFDDPEAAWSEQEDDEPPCWPASDEDPQHLPPPEDDDDPFLDDDVSWPSDDGGDDHLSDSARCTGELVPAGDYGFTDEQLQHWRFAEKQAGVRNLYSQKEERRGPTPH